MTRAFQHRLEFFIVKFLIILLNLLPIKISLRFGDCIGFIAFSILGIRRKVALTNLVRSFGDRFTYREYRRIGLKSYINFARSMIEFGLYPKLARIGLPNLVDLNADESSIERSRSGQGAVFVSGHFGNFEIMGASLAAFDLPVDFLVGKQHNLLVNDLMNRHRAIFGVGLIEIGVSARGVVAALKKGRSVAMLSDQDAGDDGVIIDFLGRPASTPKGPAAFALKTGCPIIVAMLVRNGLSSHTLHIEKPIEVNKANEKAAEIKRLTQAYSDIIADYIRRYPDHWFWAHRRWKTTCPEDYMAK